MAFEALFEQIAQEIPGYHGSVAGSFDGAMYVTHGAGAAELSASRDSLLGLVRAWGSAYPGLGGVVDFGSNDEILISASKGFLLLRLHHDKQRFVAVHLAASGNVGYLRFRMREYLRRVAG